MNNFNEVQSTVVLLNICLHKSAYTEMILL